MFWQKLGVDEIHLPTMRWEYFFCHKLKIAAPTSLSSSLGMRTNWPRLLQDEGAAI
jgi:hypothetical protein